MITEKQLAGLIRNNPEVRYELVCEILEECVTCGGELDRHGLICNRCFFEGYVPLPWVEREALRLKKEINDREMADIQKGS